LGGTINVKETWKIDTLYTQKLYLICGNSAEKVVEEYGRDRDNII
jgi:hypothetical protein